MYYSGLMFELMSVQNSSFLFKVQSKPTRIISPSVFKLWKKQQLTSLGASWWPHCPKQQLFPYTLDFESLLVPPPLNIREMSRLAWSRRATETITGVRKVHCLSKSCIDSVDGWALLTPQAWPESCKSVRPTTAAGLRHARVNTDRRGVIHQMQRY